MSPREDGSPYYNLNPEYSDTIWRAGGLPLALPLVPEPVFADRVSAMMDGLVLTGSKYHLAPERYGQTLLVPELESDRDRDDLDHLLLEWAFSRQVPVLGICHGLQAINVFLGGSLIQDIPTQITGALTHRTRSATGEYAHEVVVQSHSILNPSPEPIVARTNSAHDQTIERLGTGLKVIASSSDGVIEAVESEDMDRHFVLGVQWHPERLAAGDEFSYLPFQALTAAAARWKRVQNTHHAENPRL